MRSPIRVLVVDDSALIRQILSRALSFDPQIEVVGSARDGVEAVSKARELQPDVVTLDITMPEMNGLEALRFIVRETRARVIMLSSVDDPETTYEALDEGAVDFIAKPKTGFATSISDLADTLIKQIKTAYRIPPEKRLSTTLPAEVSPGMSPRAPALARTSQRVDWVVVVGASTGGPPALERVFAGLSADLPAAYVIVQHLPAGFTASLVGRLRRVSDVEFAEGRNHAVLEPGCAYVAPYGTHMVVARTLRTPVRLKLVESDSVHGVRPAVDPLAMSVAAAYGKRAVGVLLTGMGADGARGLAAVAQAGGATIVQDEETSVVWGMPGAAFRLGAVQRVVPLDHIAAEIRRVIRGGS